MSIIEMDCKTALNRVSGAYPYKWDLNIYRGCSHGCKYCYALYSHKYLEGKEFYSNIYVKKNVAVALEKELARHKKDQMINIGSVCDSYQPIEAKFEIMREILELFIRFEIPAIISTKSDLIMRDLDLIERLSKVAYVNVAASVITMDESLAKKLEPGAISPQRRIDMLKAVKEHTNAFTGLHCMPILPYITDSHGGLNRVFAAAKDVDVSYLLAGGLGLRGETGRHYMSFIQREFPNQYESFKKLQSPQAKKEYKSALWKMLRGLYDQHGLTANYNKNIKSAVNRQMTIFD